MKLAMTMACSAALILFATEAVGAEPADGQSAKIRCPHTDGSIDGPFAPTKAVAHKIFKAVRDSIITVHTGKPMDVRVKDEGDHWAAYDYLPPHIRRDGSIVVTAGGGLAMEVDTCTGAVTHVAFQK
jgi:hypothetical protein